MYASGVNTRSRSSKRALIDGRGVVDEQLLDFQTIGDLLQTQHASIEHDRHRGLSSPAMAPCSSRKRSSMAPCSSRKRSSLAPCSSRKRSSLAPCSSRKRSSLAPCSSRKRSSLGAVLAVLAIALAAAGVSPIAQADTDAQPPGNAVAHTRPHPAWIVADIDTGQVLA